jgi:hypothetical protein
VSFFFIAAPNQDKTILLRPRDGPYLDFISFPAFMYSYILLSSVLHYYDGMKYLMADGANSLRQGQV